MKKSLLLLLVLGAGWYLWSKRRKPAPTGAQAPAPSSTESQVSAMLSADSGVV